MKSVFVVLSAVALLTLAAYGLQAEDKEAAPKFTSKEIMKAGFKDGLCKKVADGQATDAEIDQLVEFCTVLAGNKPPRGDAESWKSKTDALVAAAKACAAGEKGSGDLLTKAMNCMACHQVHKPPMPPKQP